MSYSPKNWENTPSTATPINADNLNHMEQGIYDATQTAEDAAAGVAALQGLNYSPIPVTLVADMTDHDRNYVYLGSETGYQANHWYYWDGSAWTEGGVYNAQALVTDTTLSHAGEAADAETTGAKIGELKSALKDTEHCIGAYYTPLEITTSPLVYYNDDGVIKYVSGGSSWKSCVLNVEENETYRVSLSTHGTNYPGILFGNGTDFIKSILDDTSQHTTIYEDYIIVVPNGCDTIYINCYISDGTTISVKKGMYDTDSKFASLAETNDALVFNDERIIQGIGAYYRELDPDIEPYVWYVSSGKIISASGASTWKSVIVDVVAGESYKISTMIYGSSRYGILFGDNDDNFISSYLFNGTTTSIAITDYLINVPNGAKKMYVNCRIPSDFDKTIVVKKAMYDEAYLIDGGRNTLLSQEKDALISMLGSNREQRYFNFGFITDTHINVYPNSIDMLNSLARVSMTGNLDVIFHGGDVVTTDENDTLQETQEVLYSCINRIKVIDGLTIIQGNHDVGHSSDTSKDLTNSQYNIVFGINNLIGTHDANAPWRDYWYKDIDILKIRIICLETFALSGEEGVDSDQIDWLVNTAFDVPENFTTVIVAHYIASDNNNYNNIMSAIQLFAQNHLMAGVIVGHRHTQRYDNGGGFNIIGVGAGFNGYSIFTIDTTNKTIIENCVGSLIPRSFHYGKMPEDNYQIS